MCAQVGHKQILQGVDFSAPAVGDARKPPELCTVALCRLPRQCLLLAAMGRQC